MSDDDDDDDDDDGDDDDEDDDEDDDDDGHRLHFAGHDAARARGVHGGAGRDVFRRPPNEPRALRLFRRHRQNLASGCWRNLSDSAHRPG